MAKVLAISIPPQQRDRVCALFAPAEIVWVECPDAFGALDDARRAGMPFSHIVFAEGGSDGLVVRFVEHHVGPKDSRSFKARKRDAIDLFERSYVTELLREYHGNVTRAARAARMDRKNFSIMLKRHGIAREAKSRSVS